MSRSVVTWAGAMVAVTGLTLAAGCSGSDELANSSSSSSASGSASPSSSTTESPSASSTSPSESGDPQAIEAAAVKADYGHYMHGYVKVLRGRNARVPEFIRYSTPQRQATIRAGVADLRSRGLIFKGVADVFVKRVRVDANRATLRVCHHDSAGYFVYASTGKSPVTVKDRWLPYEVRAIMRDGRWQMNQYDSKQFSCKGAQ